VIAPVSLKVIAAVHASRIGPRLRPIAQTLAIFANDDGGDIWPGVRTLMQALGLGERAIRDQLQALIDDGLLQPDGFRGHTRRYRFNLERLAHHLPREVKAARREAAMRREARPEIKAARRRATGSGARSVSEPCTVVQGSESVNPARRCRVPTDLTLQRGADKHAPPCTEPCTPVPSTLHPGAPDLHDLHDLKRSTGTGADAPGFSHRVEKTKSPSSAADEPRLSEAEPQRPDDPDPTVIRGVGRGELVLTLNSDSVARSSTSETTERPLEYSRAPSEAIEYSMAPSEAITAAALEPPPPRGAPREAHAEPPQAPDADAHADADAAEPRSEGDSAMTPTDPLLNPPRAISDDERLRQRRAEWREQAVPLDVERLRAEAKRVQEAEQQRKAAMRAEERRMPNGHD